MSRASTAGISGRAAPGLRTDGPPWRWIDFVRRKYGRELLVDVGWIHEYDTFILTAEPHRLAFHEILLVTRGTGQLWLDDRRVAVSPGRLIFTGPGQVRKWEAREVDGVCLFFTAPFLSEFFHDALFIHSLEFWSPQRPSAALSLTDDEGAWLLARLEEMRRELRAVGGDSAHLLRAMLYEMLVRLNRLYSAASGGALDRAAAQKAVRFRELLESHLSRHHRVADYAALLGLTPGHLNAIARRHLGQSAGAIIRQRLAVEARRRLLHSDDTAACIAAELGFVDPAYFSRFVRRETGAPPSRYRAGIHEKHQLRHD